MIELLKDKKKPLVLNQRYERKFAITGLSKNHVAQIIKVNPVIFREIFHPRYVNNIYLDTLDLECYFDNIAGKTDRQKIRIRWYGDLMGEIWKPVLEFKLKSGLVGDKLSFKLAPFVLDQNFNLTYLKTIFRKSDLPDWVMNELSFMEPSLMNRYNRKYFMSADQNYRSTLDTELNYTFIQRNHNFFNRSITDNQLIIIELKYLPFLDNEAEQVSMDFPFRLSRNSKYVTGIQAFRSHIAD